MAEEKGRQSERGRRNRDDDREGQVVRDAMPPEWRVPSNKCQAFANFGIIAYLSLCMI